MSGGKTKAGIFGEEDTVSSLKKELNNLRSIEIKENGFNVLNSIRNNELDVCVMIGHGGKLGEKIRGVSKARHNHFMDHGSGYVSSKWLLYDAVQKTKPGGTVALISCKAGALVSDIDKTITKEIEKKNLKVVLLGGSKNDVFGTRPPEQKVVRDFVTKDAVKLDQIGNHYGDTYQWYDNKKKQWHKKSAVKLSKNGNFYRTTSTFQSKTRGWHQKERTDMSSKIKKNDMLACSVCNLPLARNYTDYDKYYKALYDIRSKNFVNQGVDAATAVMSTAMDERNYAAFSALVEHAPEATVNQFLNDLPDIGRQIICQRKWSPKVTNKLAPFFRKYISTTPSPSKRQKRNIGSVPQRLGFELPTSSNAQPSFSDITTAIDKQSIKDTSDKTPKTSYTTPEPEPRTFGVVRPRSSQQPPQVATRKSPSTAFVPATTYETPNDNASEAIFKLNSVGFNLSKAEIYQFYNMMSDHEKRIVSDGTPSKDSGLKRDVIEKAIKNSWDLEKMYDKEEKSSKAIPKNVYRAPSMLDKGRAYAKEAYNNLPSDRQVNNAGMIGTMAAGYAFNAIAYGYVGDKQLKKDYVTEEFDQLNTGITRTTFNQENLSSLIDVYKRKLISDTSKDIKKNSGTILMRAKKYIVGYKVADKIRGSLKTLAIKKGCSPFKDENLYKEIKSLDVLTIAQQRALKEDLIGQDSTPIDQNNIDIITGKLINGLPSPLAPGHMAAYSIKALSLFESMLQTARKDNNTELEEAIIDEGITAFLDELPVTVKEKLATGSSPIITKKNGDMPSIIYFNDLSGNPFNFVKYCMDNAVPVPREVVDHQGNELLNEAYSCAYSDASNDAGRSRREKALANVKRVIKEHPDLEIDAVLRFNILRDMYNKSIYDWEKGIDSKAKDEFINRLDNDFGITLSWDDNDDYYLLIGMHDILPDSFLQDPELEKRLWSLVESIEKEEAEGESKDFDMSLDYWLIPNGRLNNKSLAQLDKILERELFDVSSRISQLEGEKARYVKKMDGYKSNPNQEVKLPVRGMDKANNDMFGVLGDSDHYRTFKFIDFWYSGADLYNNRIKNIDRELSNLNKYRYKIIELKPKDEVMHYDIDESYIEHDPFLFSQEKFTRTKHIIHSNIASREDAAIYYTPTLQHENFKSKLAENQVGLDRLHESIIHKMWHAYFTLSAKDLEDFMRFNDYNNSSMVNSVLDGRPPRLLYAAIQEHDMQKIRLLLSNSPKGGTVVYNRDQANCPFRTAQKIGDWELQTLLYKLDKPDVFLQGPKIKTDLDRYLENAPGLRDRLQYAASQVNDVKDGYTTTTWWQKYKTHNGLELQSLLQDPNLKNGVNDPQLSNNETLFSRAFQYHPLLLDSLVKKGANITLNDTDGGNALHYGIRNNCPKASFDFILNQGIVDINEKDDNEATPLRTAFLLKDIDSVKYLLQRGATIDEATFTECMNPEKQNKMFSRLFRKKKNTNVNLETLVNFSTDKVRNGLLQKLKQQDIKKYTKAQHSFSKFEDKQKQKKQSIRSNIRGSKGLTKKKYTSYLNTTVKSANQNTTSRALLEYVIGDYPRREKYHSTVVKNIIDKSPALNTHLEYKGYTLAMVVAQKNDSENLERLLARGTTTNDFIIDKQEVFLKRVTAHGDEKGEKVPQKAALVIINHDQQYKHTYQKKSKWKQDNTDTQGNKLITLRMKKYFPDQEINKILGKFEGVHCVTDNEGIKYLYFYPSNVGTTTGEMKNIEDYYARLLSKLDGHKTTTSRNQQEYNGVTTSPQNERSTSALMKSDNSLDYSFQIDMNFPDQEIDKILGKFKGIYYSKNQDGKRYLHIDAQDQPRPNDQMKDLIKYYKALLTELKNKEKKQEEYYDTTTRQNQKLSTVLNDSELVDERDNYNAVTKRPQKGESTSFWNKIELKDETFYSLDIDKNLPDQDIHKILNKFQQAEYFIDEHENNQILISSSDSSMSNEMINIKNSYNALLANLEDQESTQSDMQNPDLVTRNGQETSKWQISPFKDQHGKQLITLAVNSDLPDAETKKIVERYKGFGSHPNAHGKRCIYFYAANKNITFDKIKSIKRDINLAQANLRYKEDTQRKLQKGTQRKLRKEQQISFFDSGIYKDKQGNELYSMELEENFSKERIKNILDKHNELTYSKNNKGKGVISFNASQIRKDHKEGYEDKLGQIEIDLKLLILYQHEEDTFIEFLKENEPNWDVGKFITENGDKLMSTELKDNLSEEKIHEILQKNKELKHYKNNDGRACFFFNVSLMLRTNTREITDQKVIKIKKDINFQIYRQHKADTLRKLRKEQQIPFFDSGIYMDKEGNELHSMELEENFSKERIKKILDKHKELQYHESEDGKRYIYLSLSSIGHDSEKGLSVSTNKKIKNIKSDIDLQMKLQHEEDTQRKLQKDSQKKEGNNEDQIDFWQKSPVNSEDIYMETKFEEHLSKERIDTILDKHKELKYYINDMGEGVFRFNLSKMRINYKENNYLEKLEEMSRDVSLQVINQRLENTTAKWQTGELSNTLILTLELRDNTPEKKIETFLKQHKKFKYHKNKGDGKTYIYTPHTTPAIERENFEKEFKKVIGNKRKSSTHDFSKFTETSVVRKQDGQNKSVPRTSKPKPKSKPNTQYHF